jgi:hypothetical protein
LPSSAVAGKGWRVSVERVVPDLASQSLEEAKRFGAVALVEGEHGRRRPGCCLDGEGEFGEGCWDSVVGVKVKVKVEGQFVVSAAQVLDECMSCTDHLGRA